MGHLEEGGLPWATLTTLNPCWSIPKVKSLLFFLLNFKILGFDFFFFFGFYKYKLEELGGILSVKGC